MDTYEVDKNIGNCILCGMDTEGTEPEQHELDCSFEIITKEEDREAYINSMPKCFSNYMHPEIEDTLKCSSSCLYRHSCRLHKMDRRLKTKQGATS